MKLFLLVSFYLFTANIINSQVLRQQSESAFELEWQKTLPSGYPSVSGLQLLNDKIYVTQTGDDEGSAFSIVNPSGEVAFSSANYARIRSLFVYENAIYTMGDERLTKRDPAGNITDEKILSLDGKGNISCKNGKILNGSVYTTNIYSYFLKYSLTGDQTFKKTIGSSDNHLLDIGGNYIYLYSSVFTSNPGSRLLQYDTLGNQKWSVPVGLVTNILADKDDNCYVFSVQPQTSNIVTKFNSNGEVTWSKIIPGQVVLNGFLFGDSLFVCGSESIDAAPGRNQNPTYSVLSVKDGSIIYQQTFDFYSGDEGFGEGFSHVAYDGKALYLGGHTGSENVKNFLVKLSREGNTTGLTDEKGARSSFSIFPNPSGSKFTISCENANSPALKITVRNSLGQVVQKKEIECKGETKWELDLGKQAAGNYTVEIISGKDKVVKKVIVE